MKKLLIPIVLVTAMGGGLIFRDGAPNLPPWMQPTRTIQQVTTEGMEQPDGNARFLNGYNIRDYPGAPLKEFYERFEPWLGEPISGFDARQQTFRMARLTATPSNPPDWRVELDNLGRLDLMREGFSPQPGSSPHPAVLAWLAAEADKGTDLPRIVGRMISSVVCDAKHRCSQWSEKQRFMFDEDAVAAEQVSRAPLGLWLSQPRTRPVDVPDESAWPVRTWGIPVIAILFGAALLRRSRVRTGSVRTF